jgi:hypothetical protein
VARDNKVTTWDFEIIVKAFFEEIDAEWNEADRYDSEKVGINQYI